MFRTIVFSALGAGVAVGICLTAAQFVTTEPLILHAEVYEQAAEAGHDAAPGMAAAAASHTHDAAAVPREEEAWQPADGAERTLYTVLANLVVGVGVSLMLLGLMAAKGEPIDARRGLLWGIGGFVAASLLPSLGLPPELPGSAAAEITGRQIWWLATAVASGLGLGLMAFGQAWVWRIAGLALIIVPHVVGAPQPPTHEAAYPAGFAGEFVAASLVVSFLLWSVSGLVGGWLHQRLARIG